MRRQVNAMGDRLLSLFVPKVKASADPCGTAYYERCWCLGREQYVKFCCSNGGCGSCYSSGLCF